jgi:hypothetical protein
VQRPTIVSITAGANDFLAGDADIVGIARRVAESVDLLLNNGGGWVWGRPSRIRSPGATAARSRTSRSSCRTTTAFHIPIRRRFALLTAALQGFDQALRFWLQFVPVPAGSRLAVVDLYTSSLGRRGLITIERRLGILGPLNFDIHPTNLGHTFIAQQFEGAWTDLED